MSQKNNILNQWFARQTDTIIRLRWLILSLTFVVVVIQFFGVTHLKLLNSNDSWFLDDDPMLVAQEQFEAIFGNDEFVIVLLEADDVFSSRALQINRSLTQALRSEVPLVDRIYSLTDLDFTTASATGIEVGDLVPDPVPSNSSDLLVIKELALGKTLLKDRLISNDAQATIIAIDLLPYPKETHRLDLEYQIRITNVVKSIISRPEYRGVKLTLGGVPIMVEGEMRWAASEMESIVGITMLIMGLLLAVFFRSFVAVIAPLFTSSIAIVFALGCFGWLGIGLQEMVLLIPLLLGLVLSVGYNVHILSFFRQHFMMHGDRREAIRHALGHASWPILFTVLTTMIGVLSFILVPIQSIRLAGIASSVLLAACVPLVLLVTPAMLSLGKDKHAEQIAEGTPRIERMLGCFGDWVFNHPFTILITFVLTTAVFAAAIPSLDVDTDYARTMGTKVPYIADGMHIADSIGSLYSYEIAFDFAEQDAVKNPDNLRKLDELGVALEQFYTFKRHSALTHIIKDLNQILHEDDPAYHMLPDDQNLTSQLLLLYEMSGGTEAEEWADYDYQNTRMQIELGSFSTKDIEAQLEFIRNYSETHMPDAKVMITGLAAVFAKVVNYMVEGQIKSIAAALFAVSLIMMIVFGSVRLGLIAMVPNVTPVIISLGAMSYLDTPLHMMTMLVAPMIIGIAVDDTIHFINHMREEFYRTGHYRRANHLTFRTVGKALMLTSAIICIGFSCFLPSELLAYHHVGLYTLIAVVSALLTDFLVTPTLIIWLKPFGK